MATTIAASPRNPKFQIPSSKETGKNSENSRNDAVLPWSGDSHTNTGRMDEWGFLSVVVSIILGLSITQLLQGISEVINERDRVRFYQPAVGWSVLLLIVDVQAWWAMFGY